MRFARPALLLLSVFGASTAFAQSPSTTDIPQAPDDVIFEKDIIYRQGHGRFYQLDRRLPQANEVCRSGYRVSAI